MPKGSPSQHPIQVAARRAGLSVDLVRAWERRYRAVRPKRSRNGRRLYRDEDIERLRLLAHATRAGRRISDIARLSTAELSVMVEQDAQAADLPASTDAARPRTESVMAYFDRCIEAIDTLNPERLFQTLNEAEQHLAELFMQEDLIAPLVQHMQDECRQGTMRLAQKRVADAVIRSHLARYALQASGSSNGELRVVVASGVARADELPVLRLAVAIRAYDWSPVYLGTELSADEIAFTAERSRALCSAIAADSGDDALLPNELRKLRRATTANHPILLHALNPGPYEAVIEDAQIIPVQTFGELRLALGRIRLDAQADRP